MKLLIICGPTATGKTALAIELAKTFNGELINADSRQIYQGLDALTGKDRSTDIPIHLYDVVSPDEEFSVAHFVEQAKSTIDDIYKRKQLPIIVGGTGFYLQALTRSFDTLTIPPNPKLRNILNTLPIEELQQRLQKIDQDRWERMNNSDQRNPRRLVRAIEVAQYKKPNQQTIPRYDTLWIGLTSSQKNLKERIAQRVGERFDKAITEVREGLPPILGVDPLLSYARRQRTKEEALIQWSIAEYQYARRQMTWFKKQNGIHWFDIQDPTYQRKVEAQVAQWYTKSA